MFLSSLFSRGHSHSHGGRPCSGHAHSHSHGSQSHSHSHGGTESGTEHACGHLREEVQRRNRAQSPASRRPSSSVIGMRIAGKGAVMFTLVASMIAYVVMTRYIWVPWGVYEEGYLSLTFLGIIVLHYLFFMWLFCYLLIIFQDPGYTKNIVKKEGEERRVTLEGGLSAGGKRWCSKCDLYKPPRSHHCSYCDKCVMRMDHHCPWVDTCIGHRNLKNFFLFLLYGMTVVLVGFVMFVIRLYQLYHQMPGPILDHEDEAIALLITVGFTFLGFFGGSGMLGMFGMQLYLLMSNMTTIERSDLSRKLHFRKHHASMRKDAESQKYLGAASESSNAAATQEPKPKMKSVNKYDLGTILNLKQVIGDNPMYWLVPDIGSNLTNVADGANYPTNRNH